jgi:hypothetical protein
MADLKAKSVFHRALVPALPGSGKAAAEVAAEVAAKPLRKGFRTARASCAAGVGVAEIQP